MGVIGFDVSSRQPFEGPFERRYERLDGVIRYAVDPDHEANLSIVDLSLAPRQDDGKVHFEGDITLLRPVEGGRGTGIVEVPNRGRRTLLGLYNRAAPVLAPTAELDPGDGFLFQQGFTVAWCGWQWDVPRSPARMGLTAPVAEHPAELQLRLQMPQLCNDIALTDHHTGPLGNHEPIPTADLNDPKARLLVRDRLWDEPTELDRSSWHFPDATHIHLDGGFEPGRIYDVIYHTASCPVAGAGLLAVRDLGHYLRDTENLDAVLATGQSQCGRFLRTFVDAGLNKAEDGTAAYDGMLIHIAGARRGEFNHRMAQPSVQPTPSFGHLFPFADEFQTDPRTGRSGGLLERQHERGALPYIIYTNTASEYWRGDASLAHTSVDDGSDIEPPAGTRHYLFASTQHGPGSLPLTDQTTTGVCSGNPVNIVDFTPLLRAAMMNLAGWVEEGVEPPRHAVPRVSDGTAASRADVLAKLAGRDGHPPITMPEHDSLSVLYPLDLGPDATDGIGSFPAERTGDAYPCWVSDVDDDGNEVAGIAMPDVAVPLATNTGWNPRRADMGAPDQILEYIGSSVPFTPEQIIERYGDEDGYLTKVVQHAEKLVLEGFLLPEDVPLCRAIAAKRFRALTTAG